MKNTQVWHPSRTRGIRSFHRLSDFLPVMIWQSDIHKRTFFNKPWLEFVGRSLAKELGNGWAGNVHADDLKGCLEACARAFAARQPFTLSYRLRRHDGVYRWVLDSGRPILTDDGRFYGYIGSCVDI